MRKYILIKADYDTNLNAIVRHVRYTDFEEFRADIDKILSRDNGAQAILLAGEICTEWDFKPVKVVKSYVWEEKK